MKPRQWQQINRLFHAALEREPSHRTAFLDEACAGDESLRREVEDLIVANHQAGSFIESPAYTVVAEMLMDGQDQALVGGSISHYKVIELLGVGGMGDVYLAQDTQLGRQIALKILPAYFTTDEDRVRRFQREALAVSMLNHPNIITIHEIGEAQGKHFIATEYIEGETLREYMPGREMKLSQLLNFAIQVADALASAHEAGVTHRDIKPENIMVRRRDGYVKVLDFGLAKLLAQPSSEIDTQAPTKFKTEAGVVMGTASYMSPEQARSLAVDARTDIFSLGVVLYEMITGCLPFDGSTTNEILASILNEKEPPPLARFARDVAPELERIVTKALRKEREERYQVIKDMLLDLKSLKQRLEFEAELERSKPPDLSTTPALAVSASQATIDTAQEPSAQPTEKAPTRTTSSTKHLISKVSEHKRVALLVLAALVIAAVAALLLTRRMPALTEKDTILLADFNNKTGDAVFDGTLKQGLAVHLGQSPFLNLFADERVRETLRLMNRSPDERVTPVIGREICQRQGLKAMLAGSIVSLGRNYAISLEAVNAQTGEVIAREQIEAEGKEQVLRSLGQAATRLREKLGESLSSIQKFDAPLDQATTSSLEALKAYTLGNKQNDQGKYLEAISSFEHAIELDPNFAKAYSDMASNYSNTGQPGLAAEAAQKAFELRERVSEREKLAIAKDYFSKATGEATKAIEVTELLAQTYPRYSPARHELGVQYRSIGQDEKAVEEFRECLRLDPSRGMTRVSLSSTFIRLNRFEEAKANSEQAIAQKVDSTFLRGNLYNIAFIHGDNAAMKQQVDWASGRPGEYVHLSWQSGAAAFAGQWLKAGKFDIRAAELAKQLKFQEAAGDILSSSAERAAVLGQCQQSRAEIARAAALPRTPLSFFRAGIALALCGDAAQAQALNDEAVKQYPKFTLVNEIYLPLVRAAMELQRGNRTQAIQMLQAISRYESVSFYYQNYLRGQAYLGERKGAEAAGEFQKILDHRGWSPLSPLYPLAQLGLARAAILQGDATKARKSYRDFLALWRDADADLPILIAAKKEYAGLE